MRVRRGGTIAIALGALLAVGVLFSPATVVERIQDVLLSPWFPVLLVGLYLVRPLVAWPITALSVIVGYRYGVFVGVPVALVGAVATSLIPFAAARYLRTDTGILGHVEAESERFFTATGDLRGVIAARLAPTPAEAISGAAGMANVSVGAFMLGTAVGELPWTIAAVVAGSSMHRLSLVEAGNRALDPWLVLGGIIAALLLLAGPAYRHTRRGRREPSQ